MMKRLPILVMIYMVAALSWWSVLLLQQNEQLFHLKMEFLSQAEVVADLKSSHERQKKMIMGEGLVFALSMVLGTYFIYKSNVRELNLSRRQSNFLLSVSHELKSPLTSINLSLETLKKRTLPQEKIIELADVALKESKRLENLISDVLIAAKLDHPYAPKRQWLDLVAIIQNLINGYTAQYPSVAIQLHVKMEEVLLYASKQDMQSIFTNLIENAIKYSQEAPINISITDNKETWLIEVADQGPGIPNSEKSKVFQKFYRLGREETRTSKGTGLGLYIVKKIVESHKGTVGINDNSPIGTIFTLNLPKVAGNEGVIG
ncbi:MAG: HAMP domain-containing histidine kinase [Saprospiraceae bacterium]|jgi:two-component system sensor histidine kinase CiaH|nr:HAMP domain-containing histidine kinase [Saprospiraceae bacterium]MBP9194552.1 HAMP domain-containing histidine kinase [Saprospiraceae bacterium]